MVSWTGEEFLQCAYQQFPSVSDGGFFDTFVIQFARARPESLSRSVPTVTLRVYCTVQCLPASNAFNDPPPHRLKYNYYSYPISFTYICQASIAEDDFLSPFFMIL
jgi:hypothetical protein